MVLLIVLFNIVWNEIKKEFLNTWSYRWQWFGEFISLFAFFFFLNMLTQKTEAGVAYGIWFYSVLIIGDISGKVSLEMRSGTFEQIYLSSIPIPMIFLSKIITSIFKAFIIMTTLLMLFWTFGYVHLSYFNYNIFYALMMITPGLFGISLLIGGLTILLKDTGWLINIINNGFLFLSGIFLPLDSLPHQLQKISSMIPTTQAISSLNEFSLNDFFMIMILNFSYLGLGIFCFFLCERKAKIKGILGHY